MARFCPNCGTQADETTKFCGKCGTRLDETPPAPPPQLNPTPPQTPPASTPTSTPPRTPPAATPVARPSAGAGSSATSVKSGGGGCGKVVVIVLVVLGLLVALGVGGAMYLAYRVKKKADEVKEAITSNDLNKMAEVLGAKAAGGKPVEPMPTFPDWSGSGAGAVQPGAVSTATSETASGVAGEKSLGGVVPLRAGLRITTAIQQSRGDYESIKEIKSVTDEGALMDYTADNIPGQANPFENEKQQEAEKKRKISLHSRRRILSEDLRSAHEYAQNFSETNPLTIANTTALGVSSSVLNDLKTKGESEFTYQDVGLKGALGGLLGGLAGMADQMNKNGAGAGGADTKEAQKAKDALGDLQKMAKVSCTLKRSDQKTYAFPVLLNNERVQLPAIRANCTSEDGNTAEFYFLDDSQNPLSLTWKLGKTDRLQVVKLEYVQEEPAGAKGKGKSGAGAGGGAAASAAAKQLEQKLEQQEKVQIYGIYFDFASAEIKPQSKPTLDEIAEVMNAHPDWKLNVAGHTDNVGEDAFNLDLSKQRAEAVKAALEKDYHISPDRLTTAGYGASSPVETNDTMEGRARNRRVELSKQ